MPNNVTTENITKKDLIDNIKKTKNTIIFIRIK